jgi:hypothetical protein
VSSTNGITREWTSTGHKVHVEGDHFTSRIPDFDERSGDHFWVVATIYQMNTANLGDATATPILDQENLVSIAGPFCYHCEKPYDKKIGYRRCSGPPTVLGYRTPGPRNGPGSRP